MIPVLTAGALVGLGLFLVGRALFPSRPSLAVVLARVNGAAMAEPVATLEPSGGWASRVGPPLARALERLNIGVGELESDLAVIGRSVEDHMALRAAGAAGGVVAAAVVGGLAGLAGLAPSLLVTTWLALGAALVGFVVPDTVVRQRAAERRRAFRQSLAFFLDLVIVVLARGGCWCYPPTPPAPTWCRPMSHLPTRRRRLHPQRLRRRQPRPHLLPCRRPRRLPSPAPCQPPWWLPARPPCRARRRRLSR